MVNRLDELPSEIRAKIWAYYLADSLKKLTFLKDRLLGKVSISLIPKEPRNGAESVSNNLLFLSEVCGVDASAFRNPLERWWGTRCGHKLHTTIGASGFLPPWYPQASTFFAAIYGRGWVDVLCLDATHAQIEFAAKKASNVPLLSYKSALRDLKNPTSLPGCISNAKCTISDFQNWYPNFFGLPETEKWHVAIQIRAMKRKYQRTIDDKANDFVRRNS